MSSCPPHTSHASIEFKAFAQPFRSFWFRHFELSDGQACCFGAGTNDLHVITNFEPDASLHIRRDELRRIFAGGHGRLPAKLERDNGTFSIGDGDAAGEI